MLHTADAEQLHHWFLSLVNNVQVLVSLFTLLANSVIDIINIEKFL